MRDSCGRILLGGTHTSGVGCPPRYQPRAALISAGLKQKRGAGLARTSSPRLRLLRDGLLSTVNQWFAATVNQHGVDLIDRLAQGNTELDDGIPRRVRLQSPSQPGDVGHIKVGVYRQPVY